MKAKYYVQVAEGHSASGVHWFFTQRERNQFMRRMGARFPEWQSIVVKVG